MTKKIAVINDLSGFGRCSLTAAIPVIAAMGVQPCPLPTAVLSAQTGYPSYYCDDYTDRMHYFQREWEKMGAEFDGIYTGFVASEQQIENIFDFLDTFHKKKTFLLVDPVLGDDGKVFDMFSENICDLMKELAARADIITPNLTELCLLTDTNYRMIQEMTDEKHLLKIIEQLARNLVKRGLKTVVVTGVHFLDSDDGILKMGNLAVTEKQSSISAFPYVGGSYSGTGDLFASVLAGGMARGDKVSECIELAGRFIEKAIVDSVEEDVPRNDGVNYEKYLGILM
ncbi:pyridoxamine kinase [Muricomes intestini]|jgi:pyridoxine kinase|uniref:pyridoxal kinase n=1 Tax=Muricomes intestini TaxID=1796634 RepID=A0A4R3K5J4_9FIRM|nr:pyridoxamine kinase [Muricomes intestini]TCS78053.1 pyridoxine kinase [Muricomes intestini]HAX53349.1 pyridoxamine kinase [Lachnospiraceae bacterium]HCR84809.1 pyridoxamine kinase [Lachnospiraceae bacterium]